MSGNTNTIVYRDNYQAPNHDITDIELVFDLLPSATLVRSLLRVVPRAGRDNDDLVLDGENLTLVSLKINGAPSVPGQYEFQPGKLIISHITEETEIEITTRISPKDNHELSGLYMSKNNYLTQCEAEGFRRITYFPDRPDVLARYKVTMHAAQDTKVLLSNGNLIEEGNLPDGRRYAVWEDPFPKPCYLFALVAGNYALRQENIELADGQKALLQIWSDPGTEDRTEWALQSLIRAIRWDEERFGLLLDLERFMIVATDDFNMGAMENKGLNVFNSKYILADQYTATDQDFFNVESVVAHEYFHNWTGNRVTCRDWFQLSLKEGLTVFRDQEFSSDMLGSAAARAVKRIEDVKVLRAVQFQEDAGPMAHPVRPDSYQEINNFYTVTVYEKGAEVVRMLQSLFGEEGFNRGLNEYINRFDGTAATCEDFLTAMGEANETDLSQFSLWYSQAGTPRLKVSTEWNEAEHSLTLKVAQSQRVFAGKPTPKPLLIPLAVGLVDPSGKDIPLMLEGEAAPELTTRVLKMTEREQSWKFVNLPSRAILSFNRGFAAPVISDIDYTREQLAFLARFDADLFNRADAFSRLALQTINQIIEDIQIRGVADPIPSETFMGAFETMLNDAKLPAAYRAEVLELPSESLIAEERIFIEPALIRAARDLLARKIGLKFRTNLEEQIKLCATGSIYSPNPTDAGKRALKLLALRYLCASQNPKALQETRGLFKKAENLTEKLGALQIIAASGLSFAENVIQQSEHEWQNNPQLMNKWFAVQAQSRTIGELGMPVCDKVRTLMLNPAFRIRNPNNVYSLLGTFFKQGGPEFHRHDGRGYQLWVDTVIEIDSFNPQVASRLARALENWRRYEPRLSIMMFKALRFVQSQPNISKDLKEIVDKAIQQPA